MHSVFRFVVLVSYFLLVSFWVSKVIRPRKPGWSRVVPALPVLLLNVFIPTMFHHVEERMLYTTLVFILYWMVPVKVLSYCMNRGVLTIVEDNPFLHIFIIVACPVVPKKHQTSSAKSNVSREKANGGHTQKQQVSPWITAFMKLVLLVFSCYFVVREKDDDSIQRDFWILSMMYATLGVMMELPAALVSNIGLDLEPHFNKPWMARSIMDFWARWNIPTAITLKDICFSPIHEGRLVYDPKAEKLPRSNARTALAAVATFFLSGVLHEMMFWCTTSKIQFLWFFNFAVNGPFSIMERLGHSLFSKVGIKTIPSVITIPLTLGFGMYMNHTFFLGPVLKLTDEPFLAFEDIVSSVPLPESIFSTGKAFGVPGIKGYEQYALLGILYGLGALGY
ncbi:hypothetical protein BSKO_08546 [Bryopsis sp. KO-2023]|nr:hypothetical protein BSKO_08546 [Bryopsis sp. KO-2023]